MGASGPCYLGSKAALGKTVHSLIRVFAPGRGQLLQPSPKQRFGEGRRRAEEPPALRKAQSFPFMWLLLLGEGTDWEVGKWKG